MSDETVQAAETAVPVAELAAPAAVVVEPQIDETGRTYATGKRKEAVARVWIKPGTGALTVNGRSGEKYFARPVLRMALSQPFQVTERVGLLGTGEWRALTVGDLDLDGDPDLGVGTWIRDWCYANGMILRNNGDILVIAPSLIISRDEADFMLDQMDRAITAATTELQL